MLFCSFCKQPREANAAPCPTCGAPSPLQGNASNFQGAHAAGTSWDGPLAPTNSWGNPNAADFADQQLPFPDQNNPWSPSPNNYGQEQQLPFPDQTANWGSPIGHGGFSNAGAPNTPGETSFPQWAGQGAQNAPAAFADPNQHDQWDQASQWGQVETPQENASIDPNAGSMLPVPYQGGQSQNLMIMPQGRMGNGGAVVPYEPPMPDEGPVYVPPMYTKPRPIIPRYRAISGLISVIVVTILLCGGVTYAAKATGKLGFVNNILGDGRPASVQPTAGPKIPDPKVLQETGPANAIIFSATTASSINTKVLIPIQPEHVFKPGQTVYVTYTVHPKGKGKVTVKWYTNNQLFHSYSSNTITDITNGATQEPFPSAMQGKVELYWNDQLAIRLYFVVR